MEFIKKNAFWTSFYALSLIYILLIISQYMSYTGYSYKGQRLQLVTVDETQVVMGDGDGFELVRKSAENLKKSGLL